MPVSCEPWPGNKKTFILKKLKPRNTPKTRKKKALAERLGSANKKSFRVFRVFRGSSELPFEFRSITPPWR
jgi:hypothetical protein